MNVDDDDDADGRVGYGRPPKATRFRKGVSGNPSGRPKKPADFDELISKEMRIKLVMNEGGKRRRLSKLEIGVKSVSAQYCKGDRHAVRTVNESLSRTASRNAADIQTKVEDEAFNRELLEDLIARRAVLPKQED